MNTLLKAICCNLTDCGYPDILKVLPFNTFKQQITPQEKLIEIIYEQQCPETGKYMIHTCAEAICQNSTNKRHV